jgi:hypothetical protein
VVRRKKTRPSTTRIAEAMYSHAGRASRDNALSTTNLDRQSPSPPMDDQPFSASRDGVPVTVGVPLR